MNPSETNILRDAKSNNVIPENLEPLLRFSETINFALKQVTKSLQPGLDYLSEFAQRNSAFFKDLTEIIAQFEEFNKHLLKCHQEESLMIPPIIADLSLDEFAKLFSDKTRMAIEVYNDFFNQPKNIELTLNTWKNNRFFEDRIPILRDAFLAHANGTHTLSIPVLLSQIEGILCEMFKVRDHGKVKGKLKGIMGADEETSMPFAAPHLIARIITEEVFLPTGRQKDTKTNYPMRHPVLHGLDPFYYRDSYASLRCILLLDLLRTEEFLKINEKSDPEVAAL